MVEDQQAACPPHRWEITMVRKEGGLHDHYQCMNCGAEKDVARGQVNSWARKGRPVART
jgi:hypothetical protein